MDLLLVAWYDLVRRVRNRSAVFTAFVGPVALGVVFSLLIGGARDSSWTIGVVDLDGTSTSRGIVDSLVGGADGSTAADAVGFERLADRPTALAAVDDADLDAAIVVPAGYTAGLTGAAEAVPLEVLADPDRPIAGQIARSVATSIGQQARLVALTAAVVLTQDASVGLPAVMAAARAAPSAVASADVPMGEREVSAGAYFGASMAVLFLFFTVGLAARSLVAERRTGTLARALATPVRLASLIAGKTLAVSVLGLAGFVSTWLVTWLGFGADWGSTAAVLALMAATVVSIAGVSMFVASLARTEQQADTYTTAVAFVLALLGGNFIGPGAAPALLRRLSRLTPNGWALEAFTSVSVDGSTLRDVLGTLGVLVAIGAMFGLAGAVALARRTSP